jgi:hypothetical protein
MQAIKDRLLFDLRCGNLTHEQYFRFIKILVQYELERSYQK